MHSPSKILITITSKFKDEVDFNGGKLWIDTSYKPEWNVIPFGTVVAVPRKDVGVRVGDKLYFNYVVVMDESNLLKEGDQEYWLVDPYNALAVVRDGVVIPVGEHILIEPEDLEVKSEFLVIPEVAKKKVKTEGVVFASNDPDIPPGSLVGFEERGMFENEIEGKKLFVMFNSNILWKKN